jgi:hypothetical protein
MRLTVRVLVAVILASFGQGLQADLQTMYGAWFAADHQHTSHLLLHNKRGDQPLTVSAYALVGTGARVLLSQVMLAPKESRSIPIDPATLRGSGRSETTGGILLEYDFFEPQPLHAMVTVRRRNGAEIIIPVLRRDQIRGNVQEAVFAIPAPTSRASLSILNTASEPRTATIETVAQGDRRESIALAVPPLTIRSVPLDPVLARIGAREAAAVRVQNSGSAGDIVVTGTVIDARTAYATGIRFNDLAHGEHHRTLRAQFLLLGPQDAHLGLPTGATFAATCALRNPTDTPKVVHPEIKWLEGSTTRAVRLPIARLEPHEVRLLDFSAAQARGEIPAAFHFGTLEMTYEGESGHVFGQLISTDRKTGFVLDDWMTSHESHAVAGMGWNIAGANQTLISVTNGGAQRDTLAVQLHVGEETADLPPLVLEGGEIALLDVRAIVAEMQLDATEGSFSVQGSHGTRSAFRLERLMVTSRGIDSDVAADDGVIAGIYYEGEVRVISLKTTTSQPAEGTTFPPGERSITLDLTTTARWSSGTAYTNETDNTEYSTEDAGMLSIKPPPSPRVTVFISIYHPPSIGQLIARFYDPCSNQFLWVVQLTFGMPATAYEILSSLQYPICDYRPTCSGLCSTSLYSTLAVTPACFPAGQPYVQCFGLSINGKCVIRRAVCTYQGVPGYCS